MRKKRSQLMRTSVPSIFLPKIMGIINLTPDSFFDGGTLTDKECAIAYAHALVAEGADYLDLGAESTRPHAMPVSEAEEAKRLFPVLEALINLPIKISIDTQKPAIMRTALKMGVHMINDVNAFQAEAALETIADYPKAEYVVMHRKGTADTMQNSPQYENVVEEVYQFLLARFEALEEVGIASGQVWVDPGIGFGKTLAHNLALLRALTRFSVLTPKVLVGLSRKSFIGTITQKEADNRLYGTLAANSYAVMQGAAMVRVHDVAAARDMVAVLQALEETA